MRPQDPFAGLLFGGRAVLCGRLGHGVHHCCRDCLTHSPCTGRSRCTARRPWCLSGPLEQFVERCFRDEQSLAEANCRQRAVPRVRVCGAATDPEDSGRVFDRYRQANRIAARRSARRIQTRMNSLIRLTLHSFRHFHRYLLSNLCHLVLDFSS
jgi:hypothetical protein